MTHVVAIAFLVVYVVLALGVVRGGLRMIGRRADREVLVDFFAKPRSIRRDARRRRSRP